MNCPSCDSTQIGAEITQAGPVMRCRACGHGFRPADVFHQVAEGISPKATKRALVESPKPLNREPAQTLTTRSLIKDARQRLTELNREVKRLEALKKERDEIVRLLAAAKQRGDGKVRHLRTA